MAGAALPILARHGTPAARAAQAILDAEQRDDVWKYWIIEALFPILPPDARAILLPSVRRIAEHPTPGERAEEADLAAREQLAQE